MPRMLSDNEQMFSFRQALRKVLPRGDLFGGSCWCWFRAAVSRLVHAGQVAQPNGDRSSRSIVATHFHLIHIVVRKQQDLVHPC